MMESLVIGLILLVIGALAPKGWRWLHEPIFDLGEQMQTWSPEQREMITEAGYDLSKLKWVISRDIPSHKYQGNKPVCIRRFWILKREVRLPRKNDYALLMEN